MAKSKRDGEIREAERPPLFSEEFPRPFDDGSGKITAEELLENPEIRKAVKALQPKPGSGESITLTTFGPEGKSVTLSDPLLGQAGAERLAVAGAKLEAGTEEFKAEGQQVIPEPEGQQAKLGEELSGVPLLTEALHGDHGALVNFRTMLTDQIKALDTSIRKKEAEKRGLEFEMVALQGQIAINEKAASEHKAIVAGAEEEAARVAVEEADAASLAVPQPLPEVGIRSRR